MNGLADIQMRAADAIVEIDALSATVTAFLGITGISRRKFGVEAVGDPDFVRKLLAGRKRRDGSFHPCDFQASTVTKAFAYISNWRGG